MDFSFPDGFNNYEDWIFYSEEQRRIWENNQPWDKYTPEDWVHLFPEMKSRVQKLLDIKLDQKTRIQSLFDLTESTFSQNLNERLFEEAWIDNTLGKAIQSIDKKIRVYRRMLVSDKPINSKMITNYDIVRAKEVPMENLIDRPIKRRQILCPFHEEKTPSCRIYPDHLHCYGCGKTLDTIGYVMETQGLSFIDSVKFLCKM
jgi:hypothetical protein